MVEMTAINGMSEVSLQFHSKKSANINEKPLNNLRIKVRKRIVVALDISQNLKSIKLILIQKISFQFLPFIFRPVNSLAGST